MIHPQVDQLRFARAEFMRLLEGLPPEDAIRRLGPMNCISWMIGHLAYQEETYWVTIPQARTIHEELAELVGHGRPASTPPLDEMLAAWQAITAAADGYLVTLTEEKLGERHHWRGREMPETVGTMLLRNIYHYWFHIGEAHAVRQQLGHGELPQFVGRFGDAAYRSG